MSSFCEVCGRELVEEKIERIVDGIVLSVCKACSKHGKPYSPPNSPLGHLVAGRRTISNIKPVIVHGNTRRNIQISDNIVLSPNFASLIREARMKKGLTHEKLAAQMNEKATLLKKFETGSLKPDEIIARKLGRFLGIQLYVNIQED